MQHSPQWKGSILIEVEGREDGGVRVSSPEVRGLILSGRDVKAVLADVVPALNVLLEHGAHRVTLVRNIDNN